MEMLKIGDYVMWCGAWGKDPAQKVKVIGIEVTEAPRMKYGIEVKETPWSVVKGNCAVLSLDNNHWCYGSQVSPLPKVDDGIYTIKFQCGRLLCGAVRDFLNECKFKSADIDFIETSGFFDRTFIIKGKLEILKAVKKTITNWKIENNIG